MKEEGKTVLSDCHFVSPAYLIQAPAPAVVFLLLLSVRSLLAARPFDAFRAIIAADAVKATPRSLPYGAREP